MKQLTCITTDKLEELIDGAHRQGVRSLDLSSWIFDELPGSIGSLTELEELDLSGTRFSVLPPSIGNLGRLKKLVLSNSDVRNVPESIGALRSLETLELGPLEALPPSLANLRLKKLFLIGYPGGCKWSCTAIIGRIASLEKLALSNLDGDFAIEPLRNLKNLRNLSLMGGAGARLPEWLGELSLLEDLVIYPASRPHGLPESMRGLDRLRRLHLASGNLACLPDWLGTLPVLEELDLTGYKDEGLPASLGKLTALKVLRLNDSRKLRSLPVSIGNLGNLETLELNSTPSLEALPDTIGRLASLKSLSVQGDRSHISVMVPLRLPPSTGSLAALEKFDLTDRKVASLPASVGGMKRLRCWWLSGTTVTGLPRDVGELTSLELLILGGLEIPSLPESFGNLRRLKTLELTSTSLHGDARFLERLTSLETLEIVGGNHGPAALPDSLCCLPRLRCLRLFWCQRVQELPRNIGRLTSLESLEIQDASIGRLPDSIGQLQNLKTLTITDSGGFLKQLPDTIGHLKSLQDLNIAYVPIRSLPRTINGLVSLTKLSLRQTKIEALPEELGTLPRLEELALYDNPDLASLPETIGGLSKLKRLWVTRSRLARLPDSIGDLSNLEYAGFDDNQLTALPASLGNLTKLVDDSGYVMLQLGGNPLQDPPPGVVGRGTSAILAYLRHRHELALLQGVGRGRRGAVPAQPAHATATPGVLPDVYPAIKPRHHSVGSPSKSFEGKPIHVRWIGKGVQEVRSAVMSRLRSTLNYPDVSLGQPDNLYLLGEEKRRRFVLSARRKHESGDPIFKNALNWEPVICQFIIRISSRWDEIYDIVFWYNNSILSILFIGNFYPNGAHEDVEKIAVSGEFVELCDAAHDVVYAVLEEEFGLTGEDVCSPGGLADS